MLLVLNPLSPTLHKLIFTHLKLCLATTKVTEHYNICLIWNQTSGNPDVYFLITHFYPNECDIWTAMKNNKTSYNRFNEVLISDPLSSFKSTKIQQCYFH